MQASWYKIKQIEDRHRFSTLASDALLGIKVREAQIKVSESIAYSPTELQDLLNSGQILLNSILSGIEFLKGSQTTKSLNPELIFIINRICHEDYLSLDELEQRCKVALGTLREEKLDLQSLSIAEHLFKGISASSKTVNENRFGW